MLRSPSRRRTARAVPLAIALAALAACSSAPDRPPGRVAFPGEAAPAADIELPDTPLLGDDAPADLVDPTLFDPVRTALAAGDWIAATLALPQAVGPATLPAAVPAMDAAPDATQLWISYYEARIANLRGDRDAHAAALGRLLAQPLPAQLAREVLLYRLREAEFADDAAREVDLGLRLYRAGGHPERDLARIEADLWRSVQSLDEEQRRALRRRGDREIDGWLDLAAAAAVAPAPEALAVLDRWQARYPGHPGAERAALLRDAAQGDSGTARLSLLLPLTGPLASASEAVTEGFLAAFYADAAPGLSVDVIDTGRFATVGDAYLRARDGAPGVIVGPLGKRQVEALLQQGGGEIPLLTLNRPEAAVPAPGGALMLSLAPEDEAAQLATVAWAAGARRLLVIRPEGSWGQRMETALRARWDGIGGRVAATAVYGRPDSYADALSAALGLDASAARGRSVRALFSERVETTGRRREDLDAIVLLARTSEEARALKPLVNYYYAGDLPVYALSTADSGSNARDLNRDLSGLQLLAMPWRLGTRAVPGLDDSSGNSLAALHAMGADAYALARRWWRMHSSAAPRYPGLTATLDRDADGVLLRRLQMAEFRQGQLQPR